MTDDGDVQGLRFRVEVVCLGYEALTDEDVPQDYIGTELDAYKEGAVAAARAVRTELDPALPPGQDGPQ